MADPGRNTSRDCAGCAAPRAVGRSTAGIARWWRPRAAAVRGVGLPDAFWCAGAGGAAALTWWRWSDVRAAAARAVRRPNSTRPSAHAQTQQRIESVIGRLPIGRTASTRCTGSHASVASARLGGGSGRRARLDRASKAFAGLAQPADRLRRRRDARGRRCRAGASRYGRTDRQRRARAGDARRGDRCRPTRRPRTRVARASRWRRRRLRGLGGSGGQRTSPRTAGWANRSRSAG